MLRNTTRRVRLVGGIECVEHFRILREGILGTFYQTGQVKAGFDI